MKRKIVGLLLGTMVAVAVLGGCTGSGDDSKVYVKGLLDVAYNKGTQDYVKAADVKEADAKNYTQQSLEAEADVMAAYFGIEEPSDEVIEVFAEFSKEVYEKVSYEVKADGDKVKVAITPVTLQITKEAQQYMDEFNVKQFVDGDESCTDEAFAKGITELLADAIKEAEKVTVEVSVSEKDGKMTVSDEDLQKIDEQMIIYE